jgi:DNA-binding PadR family transcriptional regulator
MQLTPTSYVILGMLRSKPRSGYEIKAIVDDTTRFFWAASYGQIYPELRRLAGAGLVEGEEQATGARKRTVYRLTDTGRGRLSRWLDEPAETLELRDEGLLKLFFAIGADGGRAAEILDSRREQHLEKIARLREIEPRAAAEAERGDPYPLLVLRYGIESSEWVVDWCGRARAELESADGGSP